MNIAYTIFYAKDLDSKDLYRFNKVNALKNVFSRSFQYVHNDAIIIKNMKDYKIALKKHNLLGTYKLNGTFRFGAIGLMFSTILAYEKMINMNYDAFLFLEDDAELSKDGLNNLLGYLDSVPKDFDVISLHDNPFFSYKYNEKRHGIDSENFCIAYNRLSTMAYLISKRGMQKYLNYMKTKIDNPIDFFLFDELKDTKQYAIRPTSKQIFLSNHFNEIGEPEYQFSNINKTEEITF